jgi:hypothetical protein
MSDNQKFKAKKVSTDAHAGTPVTQADGKKGAHSIHRDTEAKGQNVSEDGKKSIFRSGSDGKSPSHRSSSKSNKKS